MTNPEQVKKTWEQAELPLYIPEALQITSPVVASVIDHPDTKSLIQVPLTDSVTETPNGKKMVPVSVPDKVDRTSFRRAVAASFQAFLQIGRLDSDRIAQLSGLDKDVVLFISATEEYHYALACRGVDTQGRGIITPQQDLALMILSDIGSRKNWAGRLKDAGITQTVFNAWMKNPAFARRWQELAEAYAADSNLSLVQLSQKVGEGDMSAIKLQLAVTGRFSEAQQANIDVMAMVHTVLEILGRHLADDPDKLRAIASDLGNAVEKAQRPSALNI